MDSQQRPDDKTKKTAASRHKHMYSPDFFINPSKEPLHYTRIYLFCKHFLSKPSLVLYSFHKTHN